MAEKKFNCFEEKQHITAETTKNLKISLKDLLKVNLKFEETTYFPVLKTD